jgi:hypothetical protein
MTTVLAAHCYRTYLFGAALGTRDGLDWDAELLFVAAMLHDLGLTDFIGDDGPFERRGAAAAEANSPGGSTIHRFRSDDDQTPR